MVSTISPDDKDNAWPAATPNNMTTPVLGNIKSVVYDVASFYSNVRIFNFTSFFPDFIHNLTSMALFNMFAHMLLSKNKIEIV